MTVGSRGASRAHALLAAGLLAACGASEAPCPCPDDDCASLDPRTCAPLAPVEATASGRYTRVAPLGDRHLVAVSQAGAPGALRVVAYDAAGAVVADTQLLPPVVSGLASPSFGAFPAVAARAGRVHVAWHDPAGGRLLHAESAPVDPEAGAFSLRFGAPTVVDGGPRAAAGRHLALALADDGTAHLVYGHEGRGDLRYATRPPLPPEAGEGLAPSAASGPSSGSAPGSSGPSSGSAPGSSGPAASGAPPWAIEVIDGSEDAAAPAIVLVPGPDGRPLPRVAFHDLRHGDLELAARMGDDGAGGEGAGGGRWRLTTLDGTDPVSGRDTGDVGSHLSMAVTPGRSLAIVYHDATAGTLRALTPGEPPRVLDDGAWRTTDGRQLARTVGQFARLAITPDGVWHVVHLEADGPRWRYLRLSGERLTVATELDGLPPGGWLDLAPLAGGVAGAYGAFREAGALATTLRWFRVGEGLTTSRAGEP